MRLRCGISCTVSLVSSVVKLLMSLMRKFETVIRRAALAVCSIY